MKNRNTLKFREQIQEVLKVDLLEGIYYFQKEDVFLKSNIKGFEIIKASRIKRLAIFSSDISAYGKRMNFMVIVQFIRQWIIRYMLVQNHEKRYSFVLLLR